MEDPVCPVCTLSVRKGISLEEHLNTHPKDQVIHALIRRCVTAASAAAPAASPLQFVPTLPTNSYTPFSLFVQPPSYLHYNPVPAPFVAPGPVFSASSPRPPPPQASPTHTQASGTPLIRPAAAVSPEKVIANQAKLDKNETPDEAGKNEDEDEHFYESNEEEDEPQNDKSRAASPETQPEAASGSSGASTAKSALMTHTVFRENATVVENVFIDIKEELAQISRSNVANAQGCSSISQTLELIVRQKEEEMVRCSEVLDAHSDRSDSFQGPSEIEQGENKGEIVLGISNDEYEASDHFSVGPHSPKDNASIRDIQTDETMPPQGELSEQESIGGDSASLWGPAAEDVFSGLAIQRRSETPHLLTDWQPLAAAASRHSEAATASTSTSTQSSHTERNMVFCGTIVNRGIPIGSGGNQWRPVDQDLKPAENQEPVEQKVLMTVMGEETLLVEQSVRRQQVCSVCNQTFNSYRELQNHRRKEHRKTKYRCPICVVPCEFSERKDYLEHTKSHPLECPLCGKTFKSLPSLSLHMKREMNIRPHKCQVCDKSFITKQKLMEHSNKHSGLTPYDCKICGKGFRRYSNLIQHRDWLHLRKRKPPIDLHCSFCEQIFHSKKRMEWHLEEAHFPQPHVCAHCPQRFTHASCLTRHVRQLHDRKYLPQAKEGGPKKGYKECTECGGVYSKTSLAVHMRTHSGIKPYKCTICFKAFTTRWNLSQHMWTHESPAQLPLKCDVQQCRKAFYRKEDLEAHRRSHTKHKAYTCNVCGMKFLRKSNCMRHYREHVKDKEHTCEICSKTFHRSYYLAEHMRTHSGEKPYSCHICGKNSTTKSNHNKHLKTHLGKEPVTPEN
ncbi:zinc finger protein ZFP2-like isoform X3 [Neocloeon triangulifer]|uniref:zinc finger protein ZFP2-like isoform X3 n=1 Tax=Neocloeon triangulifer TaxID=2078957 RepID=UPI00286F7424|nr:zinc finger protein ZFP2-like isoform X3 [Neocloeon triangulifer]